MRIAGVALLMAALLVSAALAETSTPPPLPAFRPAKLVKAPSERGLEFQGLQITLVAGGAALAQRP